MQGLGSLENKVIIVTGSAQGIGAALVDKIISLGGRAVAVDLNGDKLREAMAKHGDKVLPRAGDVADPDFVAESVEKAVSWNGLSGVGRPPQKSSRCLLESVGHAAIRSAAAAVKNPACAAAHSTVNPSHPR